MTGSVLAGNKVKLISLFCKIPSLKDPAVLYSIFSFKRAIFGWTQAITLKDQKAVLVVCFLESFCLHASITTENEAE